MDDTLHTISRVCVLTGVFSAMLAMGTSVPIGEVLKALRDVRVVALMLLANFVAVPVLAQVLVRVLDLSSDAQSALVLLSVTAGTPFLTRLTVLASGHVPFAIGMMLLMMVGTVVYAPLVLPLLLPRVTVSSIDIATSLSVVMLLPLVLGMIARGRYPQLAEVSDIMAHIARPSMAIGIGAGILAAWEDLVGTLGSGILIGILLLILGGAVIGWLVASNAPPSERRVAALGTGMRNFSAALLMAGRDFDPGTLVMTTAGALIMMGAMLIVAGELGRKIHPPLLQRAPA